MAPRKLNPPYRVDHVGSFLRPDNLIEARKKAGYGRIGTPRQKGEISLEDLRKVEDDAIKEVVKFQESCGLQSITDGEYRRGSWALDVAESIVGVELRPQEQSGSEFQAQFKGDVFKPPIPTTIGKLARPEGGLVLSDFEFTKQLTDRTVKVTMPAPSFIFTKGGRDAVSKDVYPDLDEFIEDTCQLYSDELNDLAAARCRYAQFDNVDTALICDPVFQEISRKQGMDPLDQVRLHARFVNGSLEDKPEGMAVSMHLCRGNNAGTWLAEGGYEYVAEILFNDFDVDAFFMEYDDERAGDFEPLRFAPKDKLVVLGIMTTKTPQNDSKDTLKRRIEDAARHVPIENLAVSPQCGFASVDIGNPITVDDERRKIETLHEVAQEVWG